MNDWMRLAATAIAEDGIDREAAQAALSAPEGEAYELLAAAGRVRRQFHGNQVRVHVLCNAKRGGCPEDCGFCSQSAHFDLGQERQGHLEKDEIVRQAREAAAAGGHTFCIVTATRDAVGSDLELICAAVEEIKASDLPISICTSLGLLDRESAQRLASAGVDRFNHNLETSSRMYPEICTTHSWSDRVETVRLAHEVGMEACCGGILGMGESEADILDLAFTLKELEVESIPVNFLDPRPGTPISTRNRLTPLRCLQLLAVFRLINPRADLRVAGGREVNLKTMQPLALQAVNSIFTNGYLTTPGNEAHYDRRMIEEAGFEIVMVDGVDPEQEGCRAESGPVSAN